MKNKKGLLMSFDECEIIENEIKYQLQENNQEGLSEEDIRERVYRNYDLLNFAWDDLKEYLSDKMQELNSSNLWVADVKGFGWRNLDGHKDVFHCDNGEKLLQEILPKTQCTFYIYKWGRYGMKIQNFHHDSPTGNEWYYISKANKKEVETYNNY